MENMNEWLYMARTGSPDALKLLWDGSKGMIIRQVADSCQLHPELEECREDLIQEGMVCVYRAVALYRYDMNASFKTFARLLTDRIISNTLRAKTRERSVPIDMIVSLNEKFYEDGSEIEEFVEQNYSAGKPEFMLEYHEALEEIKQVISEMTESEQLAVRMWIDSINGRVSRENRTPEELRAIRVLYRVKHRILSTVKNRDR